ncbi:MAG: MFS transporter, partial [Pseudomonadota bacterium]
LPVALRETEDEGERAMTLSTGQKVGWGLADMGIVVFVMVKQLLVLDFLTNFLGVPAGVAGLVTSGILIFDIITDPIIGYMSDRTRTRFGRRAPWIATGAVVLVAGMIGMFAAPASEGGAWGLSVAWLGGFFVLATLGFTMAAIPYAATAGEMTNDPAERSRMLAWRMVFASLGILIGGGLVPALAGGTREGHLDAVVTITPVVLLAIWASLWATRKAPRISEPSGARFTEMLRIVLTNRAFLILVVFYGIMTLSIAQITAGMPFAARYLVTDGGGSPFSGAVAGGLPILTLLFAPFVLGAMVSQPLWAILSIRSSKLTAMGLGVVAYCGVLALLWSALPSNDLTQMVLLLLLAGVANGAYQAIPWALYPDLMDVTRSETGEAIEGAFSAVWLFGQKVANALAPALLGGIIAAAGWQESSAGFAKQSEEALSALQSAMTLVPLGILAIAFLVLVLAYRPAARRVLAS